MKKTKTFFLLIVLLLSIIIIFYFFTSSKKKLILNKNVIKIDNNIKGFYLVGTNKYIRGFRDGVLKKIVAVNESIFDNEVYNVANSKNYMVEYELKRGVKKRGVNLIKTKFYGKITLEINKTIKNSKDFNLKFINSGSDFKTILITNEKTSTHKTGKYTISKIHNYIMKAK